MPDETTRNAASDREGVAAENRAKGLDVFEKMRRVSARLDGDEARFAEYVWMIGRLKAVIETIQDATVTYGIINAGGESVTPMMVERDAIVEALYGER